MTGGRPCRSSSGSRRGPGAASPASPLRRLRPGRSHRARRRATARRPAEPSSSGMPTPATRSSRRGASGLPRARRRGSRPRPAPRDGRAGARAAARAWARSGRARAVRELARRGSPVPRKSSGTDVARRTSAGRRPGGPGGAHHVRGARRSPPEPRANGRRGTRRRSHLGATRGAGRTAPSPRPFPPASQLLPTQKARSTRAGAPISARTNSEDGQPTAGATRRPRYRRSGCRCDRLSCSLWRP